MLLTFSWEQRKVGDFLVLSKIPGHTGIEAKKLTVKLWGKGVVEKNDIFNGSENTQYYVRRAGQFMYGKLDFLHAAFGIVPEKLDNYESTLDLPAFDLKGIDSQFLLERVTQEDFYLRNGLVANGSRKAKRIHEETFLNMDLIIPSYKEQTQIGDLFRLINDLITVQQRKSVSKDEVMNLFLCKSNTLVDIDVYANSWEQRRLGECFSESIERTENGDLLSVTIDSGVKRFNELDRKDNSSEDKSNYKKVVVGDLVYNSMRMWQGACGTSAYNGLVSPAYTVLHVKKENIAKFFEYMFKRRESLNSFQKHSQGMTSDTWNLKFPLFSKIKMNLPSGYEQKKISNFFELLDHHITFQQRM